MHALRSNNSNVKTVSLVAITFNQILEMKKPMTLADEVLVFSNIESCNINKLFKVLLN